MFTKIEMNLTPGAMEAKLKNDNGLEFFTKTIRQSGNDEDELWELFNHLMGLAYGNKEENEPEAANVDGKFVCTRAEKLPLTVGKVYEVKGGLMESDDGKKYPIYDNPPALIGTTFVPYIPAEEPESLYNGRVICIGRNEVFDDWYTVGKEYIITNGMLRNDKGAHFYYESFEDLCERIGATWVEVKE